MTTLNLTFGIELEFICLRTNDLFKDVFEASADTGDVGPAIFNKLLEYHIPATGYESLNDDIVDNAPSHSRWRVETDELTLSKGEQEHLPKGWVYESVELSSRKFSFFTDNWHAEINKVLRVLREIENAYGCRFITNKSTGFHVHVGNGSQKIPLRVSKNVFQLATAFERCFDELHTVPRIELPRESEMRYGHCYYSPSFFHAYNHRKENVDRAMPLLDRLHGIELTSSYEDLGSLFQVFRPELGLDRLTSGHNSAYNFDNLFADDNWDRHEETLTGTIEFRQHTGTLDYLEIIAWVVLTCQVVQFCSATSDEHVLDLCLRGVDINFGLSDLFTTINASDEVRDHFLHHATIGVLPVSADGSNFSDRRLEFLVAQNDDESEERVGEDAVRAAIKYKFDTGLYGIDPTVSASIPPDAVAVELRKAMVTVHMSGIDPRSERGMAKARAQVLGHYSQLYKRGKAPAPLPLTSRME